MEFVMERGWSIFKGIKGDEEGEYIYRREGLHANKLCDR